MRVHTCLCTHMWVQVWMHVCICKWKSESNLGCYSSGAMLFVFGDRVCHRPRLSKEVKAGWLASPRNLLLQCWDSIVNHQAQPFSHGPWGSNSGPCAYKVNILPAEVSPNPSFFSLSYFFLRLVSCFLFHIALKRQVIVHTPIFF